MYMLAAFFICYQASYVWTLPVYIPAGINTWVLDALVKCRWSGKKPPLSSVTYTKLIIKCLLLHNITIQFIKYKSLYIVYLRFAALLLEYSVYHPLLS